MSETTFKLLDELSENEFDATDSSYCYLKPVDEILAMAAARYCNDNLIVPSQELLDSWTEIIDSVCENAANIKGGAEVLWLLDGTNIFVLYHNNKKCIKSAFFRIKDKYWNELDTSFLPDLGIKVLSWRDSFDYISDYFEHEPEEDSFKGIIEVIDKEFDDSAEDAFYGISDCNSDWEELREESFSDVLKRLIDEKGLTDSKVYKRAGISRQVFNNIINRKNHIPNRETVFALGIALELQPELFEKFIAKAGYAFAYSLPADCIIKDAIDNGNYNIFAINETLEKNSQRLLGAKIRE